MRGGVVALVEFAARVRRAPGDMSRCEAGRRQGEAENQGAPPGFLGLRARRHLAGRGLRERAPVACHGRNLQPLCR